MTKKVIGIPSVSSIGYVEQAFNVLNAGKAFVNLKGPTVQDEDDGLEITQAQSIDRISGWYSGEGYVPQSLDTLAQVTYTSGTEGASKGVMISHAALANTTERLMKIMEIDSSIREYVGIPVNYSFGFGRCRVVSAAGGQFYLPENGFDPLEMQRMLAAGEINAISAVPSLWRLVLENSELFDGIAGRVRWIEIGSQYMSGNEKVQLREIFPQARIVQHYGLTEASRSTFLVVDKAEEEQLESVGCDYFGVETDVREDGRIRVRGPHLASALLVEGQEKPLTDDDGWLVTSDRGSKIEDYLYFEGRIDDVINLGGIKLSPEPLEAALKERLPIDGGVAIFKTPNAMLGDQVNIAARTDVSVSDEGLVSALQKLLAEQGINISTKLPVYRVDTLPATATGKIQRSELTKSFAGTPAQLSGTMEGMKEGKEEAIAPAAQFGQHAEKVAELISIWEEVLKIHPISPGDSFFDIGGDSLSAIRVTLRMEKAGMPRDVCRRIFEGYSIENLVGSMGLTPDVVKNGVETSQPSSTTSAVSKEGVESKSSEANDVDKENEVDEKSLELMAIWRDVLKIDNITEHDSFFDLGGDSLSAIRVVMRMEKAGIDKAVCRKIFEGHSIRQIITLSQGECGPHTAPQQEISAIERQVEEKQQAPAEDGVSTTLAEAQQTAVIDPAATLKRTPIAAASLTANVLRGVLVLLNIMSHWMPGVVARLPAVAGEANRYLAPLYSSGTPGFAMVFGAGISFFILPRFKKNRASVTRLCIRNAFILFLGLLCLAIVRVCELLLSDTVIQPVDISNTFYSVLFYYFFAVISIPLWLRLLTWRGSYTFSCVAMALFFYACHLIINALNIPPSENPLIQTGILILTPKYNYLEMSAGVMLGAAAGSWIKTSIEQGRSISRLLPAGLVMIVLSILISFETGEYSLWFEWPKGLYLWTWPFYLGAILVGFYYLYRYIREHDVESHPVIGFALKLVSVIGVMAFPLFIGHEVVIPLASVLDVLSVPGSLAIAMLLFFGYSWYLLSRLYRLYYSKASAEIINSQRDTIASS